MNTVLVEGIVGMLLAALVGSFALAFASPADAVRSIAHMRRRRGVFRAGAFAVGAGIVFAAQADATARMAGVGLDDPPFTGTRALGWMLILVGVAFLDAVVWWRAGPATASGPAVTGAR